MVATERKHVFLNEKGILSAHDFHIFPKRLDCMPNNDSMFNIRCCSILHP